MSKGQWADKNVLVTGCTGMIGSWLTGRLIQLGANVIGVIRDHVPDSNLYLSGRIRNIKAVRGDIIDFNFISRVLAEYEVDTVFHLAAQTIVTIANRSPLSTFEANIKGTWTLLEACRLCPTVARIVLASSDKAYGEHEKLPYREDYPLQGRHPYDVSKSCADLIAQSYFVTYGLPLAITRLANVYGGGDLNFNRIVPGTIKAVLRGQNPVIRSDGSPLREYIYVLDAVQAYITLAENLHRLEVKGKAFNFGPQAPVSVLEIVNTIINLSGAAVTPVIQGRGRTAGEIDKQYLDSSQAEAVLKWQPGYSLAAGLHQTMNWYKSYFGGEVVDLEQC